MPQSSLFTSASLSQEAPLPKVEYDFPKDMAAWNGLVLVGEAPGREEVKLGHPFVGRSGQLLNDTLEKAGIDRAASIVANVFRFQPPGNKVDHFFISKRASTEQGIGIAQDLGKFGSLWCRADYAEEVANLRKTLGDLKKKRPLGEKGYSSPHMAIIGLGRTPLWALTGENGLLAKVGQRLDCRLAPGLSVIPTFHPSFILRGNWKLQPEWIQHLKVALQHSP